MDTNTLSWEKQMLDLSFSDKLSNFDSSSDNVLEVVEPYFDLFAEKLSADKTYMFSTRVLDKVDDCTVFNKDIAKYKLNHDDMLVFMDYEGNTCKILDRILRKNVFYANYYGRNILHVSFGIVTFFADKSKKAVTMPVFICPCGVRNLNDTTYVLEKKSSICVNPLLRLFFKNEFNIDLPECSTYLSVRDYIDNVLIPKMRYRIKTKFVEYKSFLSLYTVDDLRLMNKINGIKDKVEDRKLLQNIVGMNNEKKLTGEMISSFLHLSSNKSLKRNYREKIKVDDVKFFDGDVFDLNIIAPCDDSQIKVVNLANKDISFVVVTPPGCNKVNPLVNIISNNVMNDKRILYVSSNTNDIDNVCDYFKSFGADANILNYNEKYEMVRDKISNIIDSRKLVPSPPDYETSMKACEKDISEIVDYVTEYKNCLQKVNNRFGINYSYALDLYMQLSYMPDYEFEVNIDQYHIDSLNKTSAAIERYVMLQQSVTADLDEIDAVRKTLMNSGILFKVDALISDAKIRNGDIARIYEKYIASCWCKNIRESMMFADFEDYAKVNKIFRYKKLVDEHNEIMRGMLKTKMARRSREMAKKMHADRLKKRISRDRNMVYSTEAISLFQAVLARPEDILQMNDKSLFDVIVIDNAQNMFPLYIIPFTYYAKQAIVLGDDAIPEFSWKFYDDNSNRYRKGMSVFSVFKEQLPSIFLEWHYQSQDEHLIEFSNRKFYQQRIYTYPFPGGDEKDDMGLVNIRVKDGMYDFTGKTNMKEAMAVVETFKNEVKQHPRRSVGIIAYTVQQTELIKSMIDAEMRESVEISDYIGRFSYQGNSFFVECSDMITDKNVRDTIIISTELSVKDESGKVLDFDFWNEDTMWQVLNRTITLSRLKFINVTSLGSDSFGVDYPCESCSVFADFIRYMENPDKYLQDTDYGMSNAFKPCSELEIEFNNRGYMVKPNLGCSRNRVPMAILYDKEDPFIALDFTNENFVNYATCYESLFSREYVFETLGWKYQQIWTLFYYLDKKNAVGNLFDKVRKVEKEYGDNLDFSEDNDEFDQENIYNFPTYHKATFKMLDPVFFTERLQIILDIQAPIYVKSIFEQCSLMLLSCHNIEDSVRILNYSLKKVTESGGKYVVKDDAVYNVRDRIEFRVADIRSVKVRGFSDIVIEELVEGMRKIKMHMGKDARYEKVIREMKRLMRCADDPDAALGKKLSKIYKTL